MTDKQMKSLAIAHLRRQGHVISDGARMTVIATRILGKQPTNAPSLAIKNWLAKQEPLSEVTRAAPRGREPRRELAVRRHPRMADINRDQPRLWTPNGIGNGVTQRLTGGWA